MLTNTTGCSPDWKSVNIGDPYSDWLGANWTAIDGDLDDIHNAGITWARVSLEYSNPTTFYDQLFADMAARGITPLVIVKKNPPTNDLGDQASRDLFKSWLASMVTRYGQYTKYWEVGNEPNLGGSFWNTPDPGTPGYDQAVQNYVLHLQDAYTTIHAVQPYAVVMHGGISEWTMEPWVAQLIALNAYQYMDAIAFHPYSNNGPSGVVSRLNDFKAAIGQQPALAANLIWISEIGFNTAGWNPGNVPDEQTKATYLVQTMNGLQADGITTPITWYDLHEGNSGTSGYGLVAKDPATLSTTYMPAYTAYAGM